MGAERHLLRLHPGLLEATFLERPNRFLARMMQGDREVAVHVPNSGRLRELLRPGHRMLLTPVAHHGGRKTDYDLALVEVGGVLVSTDARAPNVLLAEAIAAGWLPEFAGYTTVRREVRLGESRLDLLLTGAGPSCYVETKSVTLVEDAAALFPDSPTERGRRHLLSLVDAVQQGHRAAVAFVVQRPDAERFRPNISADPQFSQTLNAASGQGVEVYAYRCNVTRSHVEISDRLPVELA